MFFNLRRKNDLLNSWNLIPVKFATKEAEIKLSEITAICIFRVYQEAFTNITRYAVAKKISTSLSVIDDNIVVTIEEWKRI